MNIMKVIRDLGKAITNGDWSVVCECYRELSGEDIAIPESAGVPSGDLKSLLMAALEIVDPSPGPHVAPEGTDTVPDSKVTRRGRRRKPKRVLATDPQEPEPPEDEDPAPDDDAPVEDEDPIGAPVEDGKIPLARGKSRSKDGEPIVVQADLVESRGKPNKYGIRPRMLSTKVYADEQKANRASAIEKPRRPKPKPQTYTCSSCEKKYTSKIATVGGKCPECMRSLRRSH